MNNQLTAEDILPAARVLADRSAATCNVDKEDNWKLYSEEFFEDAKAALEAYLATRTPSAAAGEVPTQRELKLAKWISQQDHRLPDHACAECAPHSEILIPGFRCAYHEALALLASPQPPAAAEAGGTLTPLDYRAQGREEALAIILAQDPEEPFADCTSSSQIADTGDYSTSWNEGALRELLHIEDRKYDVFDRAEDAHWQAMGHLDEAHAMKRMVERASFYKPLHDYLEAQRQWDLLADLKRAAPTSSRAQAAGVDERAENKLFDEWLAEQTRGVELSIVTHNQMWAAWKARAALAATPSEGVGAGDGWVRVPRDATHEIKVALLASLNLPLTSHNESRIKRGWHKALAAAQPTNKGGE